MPRALVLVLSLGCAALAHADDVAKAPAPPRNAPSLTHVFRAEVTVASPTELGVRDGVRKRLIPITGGRVEGERLRGEVLPGGADWQGIREDGTAVLDARYVIRTTDGVSITVSNVGVRRGPPDVMKRLAAGEPVDPSAYYFRTTPAFDVAAGPYGWLRDSVFVCSGARKPTVVVLDCYAVQ